MKCLELFSGAGGLARGLELAGFQHQGFVEVNRHACDSLRKNYTPNLVHHVDVANFDFQGSGSQIDLIAGGPPCQPFSLGGKHNGNADTRDLFPYAIKAVRDLSPRAFVFENVKGLLRDTFAPYFSYILLRLTFPEEVCPKACDWQGHLSRLQKIRFDSYSGLKYLVKYQLLNAADYGVPQIRERVLIVGTRTDGVGEWEFPAATHSQQALEWSMHTSKTYWERHGIPSKQIQQILSAMEGRNRDLAPMVSFLEPSLLPWVTVRDAIGDLPDPASDHGLSDHQHQPGARSYPGHTGSDLDWPAKTIKAGGHGVPGGENMIRFPDGTLRYFSVLEAKRIQTFPDDYAICGAWGEAMRQIGNAVPVRLAAVIGQSLFAHLRRTKAKVG